MGYGDFKDLNRRTSADELLRDKTFNIAKNPKYDEQQHGLASRVYKFFDKKAPGSGIKNKNISNKQLAEELHKLVIRNFKRRKKHSPFIGRSSPADVFL